MAWKYDGVSQQAFHVESQTQFRLNGKRKLESPSDFELIPPEGAAKKWYSAELDNLKKELWVEMQSVWEQAALRMRLQSLIRTKLRGDNYRAANVISGVSGKTVSARSIQAWLVDPTRRSSRKCPEWAVEALEAYSAPVAETERVTGEPLSTWEIKAKFSVDFAERQIEAKESLRKKWMSTPVSSLPEGFCELELKLNTYFKYLSETQSIWTAALRASSSFEEFRRLALEKLDDAAEIRLFVEETRRAIEQGSEEFSNEDGLPGQKGANK